MCCGQAEQISGSNTFQGGVALLLDYVTHVAVCSCCVAALQRTGLHCINSEDIYMGLQLLPGTIHKVMSSDGVLGNAGLLLHKQVVYAACLD